MTIDEATRQLDDAIRRVAEAARDLSDEAQRIGNQHAYEVDGESMTNLRDALRDWTSASEQALRITATTQDEPGARALGRSR